MIWSRPPIAHAPAIAGLTNALAEFPGAIAARMSGSGATCFALFVSGSAAERCARKFSGYGHWAMASKIGVG